MHAHRLFLSFNFSLWHKACELFFYENQLCHDIILVKHLILNFHSILFFMNFNPDLLTYSCNLIVVNLNIAMMLILLLHRSILLWCLIFYCILKKCEIYRLMESLTKASTAYMLCELGFDTVDSWLIVIQYVE